MDQEVNQHPTIEERRVDRLALDPTFFFSSGLGLLVVALLCPKDAFVGILFFVDGASIALNLGVYFFWLQAIDGKNSQWRYQRLIKSFLMLALAASGATMIPAPLLLLKFVRQIPELSFRHMFFFSFVLLSGTVLALGLGFNAFRRMTRPRLFCPCCHKFIDFRESWICASCNHANKNRPFLLPCANCDESPKTLQCPNPICGRIISLNGEQDSNGPAKLRLAEQKIETRTPVEVRADLKHRILTTELQIDLAKKEKELRKQQMPESREDWFNRQIEAAILPEKLLYEKDRALDGLGEEWKRAIRSGPLPLDEQELLLEKIQDRISEAKARLSV